MELAALPRNIWKHLADGILNAFVSIRGNHQEILEAELYAPSGMGAQQAVILKITDPETVRTLGKINGKIMGHDEFDAFYGAPVVFAVLAPKDSATAVFDGSSVITNMLNEAASLGLGSCWIHRAKEQFETEEGRKILQKAGIDPDKYIGIDNVILGYADGPVRDAAPRKDGRVFSI